MYIQLQCMNYFDPDLELTEMFMRHLNTDWILFKNHLTF